ncbi:hypothetical protein PsorP6_006073 [Peronosclerospora sorghi]|uniref:Uncharacterized protein n=1 Tax=Peronosclerospora sorghi TaxID=230839 RepID=A0ACC0W3Y7_9STRA|nr:hypothetical protein PsorP6_006073 [Peronosclerospora sorghi]
MLIYYSARLLVLLFFSCYVSVDGDGGTVAGSFQVPSFGPGGDGVFNAGVGVFQVSFVGTGVFGTSSEFGTHGVGVGVIGDSGNGSCTFGVTCVGLDGDGVLIAGVGVFQASSVGTGVFSTSSEFGASGSGFGLCLFEVLFLGPDVDTDDPGASFSVACPFLAVGAPIDGDCVVGISATGSLVLGASVIGTFRQS